MALRTNLFADSGKILTPLALALLLSAGCPGWPAPPVERAVLTRQKAEDTEFFVQEQGRWISLSTFTADSGGRAGKVLESPWIELVLDGEIELGKPLVYVVLGTDSSRIESMPGAGCFPGLITDELVPLTEEGPPRRGCKERGYGLLRYCPSNAAYQLPIYLSAYSVHDARGAKVASQQLVSVAQIQNRELQARPLGLLCNNQRQGAAVVTVPSALFVREWLHLRLRVKLIVDAREATGLQNETTYLRAKAINK